MSKTCHFYATRDDLIDITKRVESTLSIRYVRFGHVSKLPPESFDSAARIPNLGKATQESGTACEKFLICDSHLTIRSRQLGKAADEGVERSYRKNVKAVVGVERFTIDQLYNPDTIIFNPGGIWKEKILLQGDLGVAHNTKVSKELMKHFKAAIKSTFIRVRAYWVGPQALKFLKSGKRLTPAEQCSPELDLKLAA